MRNILHEIETKYPISDVRANGEQVWPYLRMHYQTTYTRRLVGGRQERMSYTSALSRRLRLLPATLYGMTNWLRQYDYVCLSSAGYRRVVNGRQFNRFLDPVIDELGAARALMIEAPFPGHFPRRQVHTRNIASSAGLGLAAWTIGAAQRGRLAVENAAVLEGIHRDYGIGVPYRRHVRTFQAECHIYRLLFQRLRPRTLFLTCFYGREAAIKAAHYLGMQVVEVQHGVIGRGHAAYNIAVDMDRSCFPDHILVFGEQETATFRDGRFVDPTHVHPVGSFYIDHIKATHKVDSALSERLSRYKRTVGVTLQLGSEKRLLDFVCATAALDVDILYLIIPRRIDNYLSGLELPENVTIIESHDFYEVMMYVDFHSTITSTCALEAPSLGVQNILVNLDDAARRYYGAVLVDKKVTLFANSPAEYVHLLHTTPRIDRELVCKLNEHIIKPGYAQNIQALLAEVLRL